jgi:predicted RNase H-like HicB family nuclease
MDAEPTSRPPGILETSISGAHMTSIKVIVDKHEDGYVAYPLGLSGVVVGQGDSYEAALADVRSAIEFHIETFGVDALPASPVLEAFVAEATIAA